MRWPRFGGAGSLFTDERTNPNVVERRYGTTGNRWALRVRDGSRRGSRGRPVLQEQVLAAPDGELRAHLGVRGVLLEIPESSLNQPPQMLLTSSTNRRVRDSFIQRHARTSE